MDEITLAVVGAGRRGNIYAEAAVACGRAKIVAVAEPDDQRRTRFAEQFGLPPTRSFSDWTELAEAGRIADAVVIATQDDEHLAPTVVFAGLGYHILLETPMAPSESGCVRIATAVERAGVIFTVGHAPRYTPYGLALTELLVSGRLGRITGVQHLEPIGRWHFANAYDWLIHLVGSAPERVSSFGSRPRAHQENAPADGCLDADNAALDHQVVMMEHPGGVISSLTIGAFAQLEQRKTRVFGTDGYASGNGRMLRVTDFPSGKEEVVDTQAGMDESVAGEIGLAGTFLAAVAAGDQRILGTDAWRCVQSHAAAWAAERAWRAGSVVRSAFPPQTRLSRHGQWRR